MAILRVSKKNPCPVCGRPDWCGISDDGKLAICMRTPSGKQTKNGGYMHWLDKPLPKKRVRQQRKQKTDKLTFEQAKTINRHYRTNVNSRRLAWMADRLGVSQDSLYAVGIGFDDKNFTFPMYNANGKVIGIRKRSLEGKKFAEPGSSQGLFLPKGVKAKKEVFIAEGPTDTAALLDLGIPAIGRPSCMGGNEMIKQMLKRRKLRVGILADKDPPKIKPDGSKWHPGKDGAYRLGRQIKPLTFGVKIIFPRRGKDIREWLHNGATRDELKLIVKNTRYLE